jgi:transcriptional regulator with XRE-family HTH domain
LLFTTASNIAGRRGSIWRGVGGDESMLMIGERLRTIRESKNLSQGDIEKRTGLIRCYTSRIENGHTVPSIETLAKYAQALDIPLYQIFYDGEEAPKRIKGVELDERSYPSASGARLRALAAASGS